MGMCVGGVSNGEEPKKSWWVGCVTELGSDHVMLRHPDLPSTSPGLIRGAVWLSESFALIFLILTRCSLLSIFFFTQFI